MSRKKQIGNNAFATRRIFLIYASIEGKTRILLALGLILLCTILPENTSAQARRSEQSCAPTRDSTILKSRENELRATGEKLLRAFRAGDTKTFLDLVHPKYFSEGAEGKKYTLAELKKSFRAREEMYCYLFDASCIPPQPPPGTVETSFSEAANRPQARVQSIEIDSGKGITKPGCGGSVNFSWVDPIDPIHVSTFAFMYVGGQWKTVGFDFPPAATLNPGVRSGEKPRTSSAHLFLRP